MLISKQKSFMMIHFDFMFESYQKKNSFKGKVHLSKKSCVYYYSPKSKSKDGFGGRWLLWLPGLVDISCALL